MKVTHSLSIGSDLPHPSLDLVIPDPCRQTKLNTNLSVKYNLWCLSWSRSLTTKVPDPSKYICRRGDSISAHAEPLLQLSGLGGGGGVRLAGSLNTSDFISEAQWEAQKDVPKDKKTWTLICKPGVKSVLCSPLRQLCSFRKRREEHPTNHNMVLNCSLRSVLDIIHGQLDLCHLIDERVLKEGNAA